MRRFAGIYLMFVLWFCATGSLAAQEAPLFAAESGPRHLMLLLKDKPRPADTQVLFSPRAAKRRLLQGITTDSLDWPLNGDYVKQVVAMPGVRLRYASRWMNALLVQVRDSLALQQLLSLPMVSGIEDLGPALPFLPQKEILREPAPELRHAPEPAALDLLRTQPLLQMATRAYGMSYEPLKQMNGIRLHDLGFRGKGMLIAVLDAGFPGVNRIPAFDSLNNAQRIIATRDFVNHGDWVYAYSDHGTRVLGCLAAQQPNVLMGAAPDASYLLLRTEDADSEWPVETFYWLLAAEYADSMGADIINSSLGYTTFDDPLRFNFGRQGLDGKTTLISRAAAIAATRGMLVLSAAGNEGDGFWERISAPADADGVLSVGATDLEGNSASFSGHGPAADGRLKPELAAPGVDIPLVQGDGSFIEGSGTSYATPLLSGLAACLWQSVPQLNAESLREAIIQSCNHSGMPDPFQGHGIPDFYIAASLLGSNPYFRPNSTQLLSELPESTAQSFLYMRVFTAASGSFRYALFSRGNNRRPVSSGSVPVQAQSSVVFLIRGLEHPGPYMLQLSSSDGFNRIMHINKTASPAQSTTRP